MKKLTVTRMELLARKEQIAIASEGLSLLEQKRAALLRELMKTADRVLAQREALEAAAMDARRALALAEGVAGETAVRSAAMAAQSDLPLAIQTANVMGMTVPVIEEKRVSRPVTGRGYALSGTPIEIDEAAAAFEDEIDTLLALAESELRLQRLAGEIQNTTRQANALEQAILPRLRAERDFIAMALAEREREAHFRLKRIRNRRRRHTDTQI